jgi:hypothetical protein
MRGSGCLIFAHRALVQGDFVVLASAKPCAKVEHGPVASCPSDGANWRSGLWCGGSTPCNGRHLRCAPEPSPVRIPSAPRYLWPAQLQPVVCGTGRFRQQIEPVRNMIHTWLQAIRLSPGDKRLPKQCVDAVYIGVLPVTWLLRYRAIDRLVMPLWRGVWRTAGGRMKQALHDGHPVEHSSTTQPG